VWLLGGFDLGSCRPLSRRSFGVKGGEVREVPRIGVYRSSVEAASSRPPPQVACMCWGGMSRYRSSSSGVAGRCWLASHLVLGGASRPGKAQGCGCSETSKDQAKSPARGSLSALSIDVRQPSRALPAFGKSLSGSHA
jgi:hypothetical protein